MGDERAPCSTKSITESKKAAGEGHLEIEESNTIFPVSRFSNKTSIAIRQLSEDKFIFEPVLDISVGVQE